MRLFAAVVFPTVAAFDPAEALWSKFKQEFQKKYEHDEEARRVQIFRENLSKIMQRNAEQSDYVLEVNEFADLSQAEFASQRLGTKIPANFMKGKASLGVHEWDGVALPTSVDWTTQGAVTPVKNQGQCGSCWSFSTTGALEGANFIANGKLVSLSEQEFVDCDTKVDQGCNGGLMDNAFTFAESNPVCTEASYPYTATDGTCTESTTCVAGIPKGGVSGYKDVAQTDNALMSAIAQQPVSVAIEADQLAFQFYSSGVLTGTCGTNLDHGVLAVGYGTENGKDYYKVKNSWGASWGMNGYVLIQRGATQKGGKCGILLSASYPVVAQAESRLRAPSGTYCGKNALGSGTIKVDTATAVDISMSALGQKFSCTNEGIQVESSGAVDITNIQSSTDCVHEALAKYGLGPSALTVNYNAASDEVTATLSGSSLTLTHAACSTMELLV